jgi:hypothetical protein
LAQLVRGLRCKVNLIPFNEFPESPFRRPTDEAVLRFQAALTRAGLDVFIRKSKGQDILGACGQLGTIPPGTSLLHPGRAGKSSLNSRASTSRIVVAEGACR